MTALHPAQRAYEEGVESGRRRRDEAIRAELAKGKTYRAVAAEFGVSHQLVAEVARRS